MRRLGLVVVGLVVALALAAPVLAPNDVAHPFPDRAYAPPTRVHVLAADGWHAPFIYRPVLVDRLLRIYGEDRKTRVPIRWFRDGRLLSVDEDAGPLMLLGGDELGRDLFSRLLLGARLSIGVTVVGAFGALVAGAAVGAIAGVVGGLVEMSLMWIADFMLVLPAVYLLMVLRAALPLSLSLATVFGIMAALFAAAGWPRVARGVRGIVATERAKDYAQAARAAGASRWRIARELLPAATGLLVVELALLVPALLVAEATLSYLGLGFPPDQPSWGTLLQSAGNVQLLADAPWLLAPAAMLFVVVLGLQVGLGGRGERVLVTGASR